MRPRKDCADWYYVRQFIDEMITFPCVKLRVEKEIGENELHVCLSPLYVSYEDAYKALEKEIAFDQKKRHPGEPYDMKSFEEFMSELENEDENYIIISEAFGNRYSIYRQMDISVKDILWNGAGGEDIRKNEFFNKIIEKLASAIEEVDALKRKLYGEKTLPVYRSKESGNSYIVSDRIGDTAAILFPFVGIRGMAGTIPYSNIEQDDFIGDVIIDSDNTPNFDSLMSLTKGR